MRNKYRDIDIIEVDDYADIADVFMGACYHTDNTVGVIADYDLIAHIVDVALEHDDVSVKYIDLLEEVDRPYFVSINDDGDLLAAPVEMDGFLWNIDVVYINMDGKVRQEIIDMFVDNDADVTLFGYADEEPICNPKECGKSCDCGLFDKVDKDSDKKLNVKPGVKVTKDKDGDMSGVSFSRTDNSGGYESWSVYSNRELPIEALSRLFPHLFK